MNDESPIRNEGICSLETMAQLTKEIAVDAGLTFLHSARYAGLPAG